MDALREASLRTQVIATTHSPDLLSEADLERDGLLVVVDGAELAAVVRPPSPGR
jgi:predicted ATP-dependent endonuclease of OLD family